MAFLFFIVQKRFQKWTDRALQWFQQAWSVPHTAPSEKAHHQAKSLPRTRAYFLDILCA